MPCTLPLKTSGILKRCLEVFIMQKSEGIVTRRQNEAEKLLKEPQLRFYEREDCQFSNYFLHRIGQFPLKDKNNSEDSTKKKTITLRPVDWRPI